jgi:predicted metal-binding protein
MIENIFTDNITLVLLSVASLIFLWLAIKSRDIKKFQFQVSVFVIMWIVGEVAGILQENNLVNLGAENVGMQVHLASMVFLSCMLWFRYYTSKRNSKKMIESLDDYDN